MVRDENVAKSAEFPHRTIHRDTWRPVGRRTTRGEHLQKQKEQLQYAGGQSLRGADWCYGEAVGKQVQPSGGTEEMLAKLITFYVHINFNFENIYFLEFTKRLYHILSSGRIHRRLTCIKIKKYKLTTAPDAT
jgi:hypothetical protein